VNRNKELQTTLLKKTRKRKDYLYEYHLKELTGLRFTNLVEMFGIDGACAVVERIGGQRLYIPKKSTLRADFRLAAFRTELNEMLENDTPRPEIVEQLSWKYGYSNYSINQLIRKRTFIHNKYKVKIPLQMEVIKIRDAQLMELVKKYGDKIEKLGLI
jgi:hypothetical protein